MEREKRNRNTTLRNTQVTFRNRDGKCEIETKLSETLESLPDTKITWQQKHFLVFQNRCQTCKVRKVETNRRLWTTKDMHWFQHQNHTCTTCLWKKAYANANSSKSSAKEKKKNQFLTKGSGLQCGGKQSPISSWKNIYLFSPLSFCWTMNHSLFLAESRRLVKNGKVLSKFWCIFQNFEETSMEFRSFGKTLKKSKFHQDVEISSKFLPNFETRTITLQLWRNFEHLTPILRFTWETSNLKTFLQPQSLEWNSQGWCSVSAS